MVRIANLKTMANLKKIILKFNVISSNFNRISIEIDSKFEFQTWNSK